MLRGLGAFLLLFGLLFASDFMREVIRELVKELPLEEAIKVGRGERKLVVFMNPDCPHCRKEWSELKKHLDKVQLYVFLVPFSHWGEENLNKVYYALCSSDPRKALAEVMEGKLDGKKLNPPRCDRLDAHLEAARLVGLEAVPYNILPEEGIVIEGAGGELYEHLGIK